MEKYTFQIFATLLIAIGIGLLPATAIAQTPECEALRQQLIEYGGGQVTQLPSYCDEATVYARITYWLYYIIGLAAVISIIYGGYLYMTAASNDEQRGRGKKVIIWTIAGVVLALLATMIVGVVINLIVDNRFF
jgi:hypothetical protein